MQVDYGNAKLIEIPMIAGQREYSLKDQNVLNDRKISSLVVLKGGLTPSGKTVQDPINGYLVMKDDPSQEIRQTLPCKVITYEGYYPVLAAQGIDMRKYNWEECTLKFGDDPTAGNVFQMLVIYTQEVFPDV